MVFIGIPHIWLKFGHFLIYPILNHQQSLCPHCKKSWRSGSNSTWCREKFPASMKTILLQILNLFDKLLLVLNFFAINAFPMSNMLDDNHRTYTNILQMSNFFDRNGLSQKWHHLGANPNPQVYILILYHCATLSFWFMSTLSHI